MFETPIVEDTSLFETPIVEDTSLFDTPIVEDDSLFDIPIVANDSSSASTSDAQPPDFLCSIKGNTSLIVLTVRDCNGRNLRALIDTASDLD